MSYGLTTPIRSKSLGLVKPKRARKRIVATIVAFLLIVAAVLAFVPWQQTVVGNGQVLVYDAMSRPQAVESFISGRIAEWRVQEGDIVAKGQVIARLEDIDSKFLDRQLVRRTQEQLEFAKQGRNESERRIRELEQQRDELRLSRARQISVAEQVVEQALARERAAREALRQAEQTLSISSKVAVASANERVQQARDRVNQGKQAVDAARQQLETQRLRLRRVARLEKLGLQSVQALEFAQNDEVKARTDLRRAEDALRIARRDVNVGALGQDQAGLEVIRARAARDAARAQIDVALGDVANARFSVERIKNDTSANLFAVGGSIQSAKETFAKNSGDIRKLEAELANLTNRSGQQVVTAPTDGRVARLLTVGAGATVKAGDQLCVVVPDTTDRAVELFLSDNDIPLVTVGRPVRVQFAGWPAAQFSGFPSVAVGTFGGRVAVIDPVDDGTSRFRVIVRQDRQTLPSGKKDPPWPDPTFLRPGAESIGWVMLDQVPLGFELWRQFNGFPARAPRGTLTGSPYEDKEKAKEEKEDKKEKDSMLGPVKLKKK